MSEFKLRWIPRPLWVEDEEELLDRRRLSLLWASRRQLGWGTLPWALTLKQEMETVPARVTRAYFQPSISLSGSDSAVERLKGVAVLHIEFEGEGGRKNEIQESYPRSALKSVPARYLPLQAWVGMKPGKTSTATLIGISLRSLEKQKKAWGG